MGTLGLLSSPSNAASSAKVRLSVVGPETPRLVVLAVQVVVLVVLAGVESKKTCATSKTILL